MLASVRYGRQGSAIPSDFQLPVTNVLDGLGSADLSGDPSRPGFYLLEPVGRVTDHFYPPSLVASQFEGDSEEISQAVIQTSASMLRQQ